MTTLVSLSKRERGLFTIYKVTILCQTSFLLVVVMSFVTTGVIVSHPPFIMDSYVTHVL